MGLAAPVAADPVYEITARWADDTPDTVASGDVVNAEWRVNVNDDAPAPSNDPVDDVNFTLTLDNGFFSELPDACLTEGVDPVSEISEDGRTLVCNIGTQDQGTAYVLQTAIVADGETGSQLEASGEIDGQAVELPPITIENPFLMDIAWQSSVTGVTREASSVDVAFQWTLFLGAGSDPGPDTVSYTLDVAAGSGAAVAVAPDACSAFTEGRASGHPWSGGDHPDEQLTSFVDSCTLTETGTPGSFLLTLSGIDYSRLQVPSLDSVGLALPTDRDAIASGSVTFRVDGTQNDTLALSSTAPTYTSPGGAESTDDPANNTSSKTWTTGAWSSAWQPESTGYPVPSWWSDQFRVAPGAEVQSVTNVSYGQGSYPATDTFSQCAVLDTRYVSYEFAEHRYGWAGDPVDSTMEWYVGGAATLDPDSASYDPNAFRCANDPGGWTTVEPADPSAVKAVRVTYPFSAIQGAQNAPLTVRQTVNDDVAVGQDIWMFGEVARNGTWVNVNRGTTPDDAGGSLLTPDARYPFTANGRDIVRIVGITPAVSKTVDRAVVQPGEPASFTLTYSANGTGPVEETVDGFELVDTLPAGMTYVPGSASPAPVVSTDDEGHEVLTWVLDGVLTNTQVPLTYQAVADSSVDPGQTLTNSVTASAEGATSLAATAQVTVSTAGYTTIGKSADTPFIPNPDGDGVGEGSWTVTLRSFDPLAQDYTDTIDILPFNGDERGTDFAGSYALTGVDAVGGATVYYTTADPATLSDDPADASNGAAGDVAGNTVGWSTTFTTDATAVRVIGPELAPGATQQFTLNVATDGVEGGDVLVNRAQARDGHTELVMRTSAPITVANYYSASLKKYVQDLDGEWRDANTVEDYPSFKVGDTIRYRIVVENTGQGTLTGIEVSDDLQPELGSFTIDELAPGEEEVHEFEIVADESVGDGVVNTACAAADVPEDSQVPPSINCDPAGFEVDGDPTHAKELVSATPIGDGQWEVVYGIEVSNTSTASTSYSLDDTLRFTDQATIVSAEVTGSPDGVTLADPAWDGQDDVLIASDVPLAGNDDDGYAPHEYVLTVIADVPLQLEGAGADPDSTDCPAEGDAEQGFNNTSELTKSNGEVEPDQACARVPSIDVDKTVSAGPTPNGDATWTVTYDVVATNGGAVDGTYEVTDRMTADGDLEVVSGAVVSAPDGVTPNASWTGLGAEGDAQNVIASDVSLPAGESHTYQVEVVVGLVEGTEGQPVITPCSALGEGGPGGLSNTAEIEHNDLTDDASACVGVGVVLVDKTVGAGPTPNGDGTWTVVYDIVAEHVGGDPADYDVTDRLHFGEGIEIVEAGVITAPDGVETNPGWTGLGAEESDPENLVAAEVTMPVGGTHTYQVEVTVQMDEATIDPSVLECPPPGSGEAGGLANSTSLTSNGIVALDDVCPSVPLIIMDKELSEDSPVANGDGTWTITYDVTASNVGQAAGDYDLSDELRYGEGIDVVESAIVSAPAGVTPNTGWTGQGTTGSAENVIVTGQMLDAGASHTFQVEVVASLDLEVVTPETLECPEPGSGEPGGFANTAALVHNGEPQTDDACTEPPLVDVTKSISGAVSPVDGVDGQYDVTYELVVTNRGPGAGDYDLTDSLAWGTGISVVGIQDVTTDVEDSVGINGGFDGIEDTLIVTDQPIAGATGASVVHTYTVTVRYAADLSDVVLPDTDECTSGGDAVDGALVNVADVTWNGIEGSDAECVRSGKPTLDKALVSAEPVGDGQWEVVYDLTVGNVGREATTYDLDDELLFAPVITVDSVSVTGPEGVTLDGGFDGAGQQRIATDVSIAGLDDDGYAPHVYTVTVVADVPLTFDSSDVGADGTGSPACTEPTGSNLVSQGLNNAATLTDENGNQVTDTDCAELPSIDITKSVVGEPGVDDGVWTITYDIVAINDGAARGVYTLTDRLRFGAGIEVTSATVTDAPDAAEVSPSWTGLGAEGSESTVISTDVPLRAGGGHTYRVQVTATLDESAADASTFTCPEPGSGEPGGFVNVAGIGHNDLTGTAEACATPPGDNPPGSTPPGETGKEGPDTINTPIGSLPRTGATIAGILALAVLLTLAGAYGVRAARRNAAG
ncbi:hypothetical protein GCM10009718_33460 [Isoptericola halotolerans]